MVRKTRRDRRKQIEQEKPVDSSINRFVGIGRDEDKKEIGEGRGGRVDKEGRANRKRVKREIVMVRQGFEKDL